MELNVRYYQDCFDASKNKFMSLTGIHPVIQEFKSLISQVDIDGSVTKLEEEINNNIIEYWTNPKFRSSDLDIKLDALLFEYERIDEINSKAYAYGVVKYRPDNLNFPDEINLKGYDLCSDFQSHPGFTLSVTNHLHKTNWKSLECDYPGVEIYFENGWNDLMNVYKNAVYLTLSKAFEKVVLNGGLKRMKMNDKFYILIQEHDCSARLIAK